MFWFTFLFFPPEINNLAPNESSGASQVRTFNFQTTQLVCRPFLATLVPAYWSCSVVDCVCAGVSVCVRMFACVRVCVNRSCNLNTGALHITHGINADAKGRNVQPVVSTPLVLQMSSCTSTAAGEDNFMPRYFSPLHSLKRCAKKAALKFRKSAI